MKELKALKFLKEQRRRHQNMADSMKVVYFDDELDEAIKELEELNNRSCKSCKYSFDIFTGIDNNLLGEDFICTKLEVDKVFEKNFCCNRYEKKGSK